MTAADNNTNTPVHLDVKVEQMKSEGSTNSNFEFELYSIKTWNLTQNNNITVQAL